MPGRIKTIIDLIIEQKSGGDEAIKNIMTTKLILKGIDPDDYQPGSEDDPAILGRLEQIASDLSVSLA